MTFSTWGADRTRGSQLLKKRYYKELLYLKNINVITLNLQLRMLLDSHRAVA